jgi:hypothetical protein
LLATDRVIPVAHGTTFEALPDVSPLLAARSGLSTEGSSLAARPRSRELSRVLPAVALARTTGALHARLVPG